MSGLVPDSKQALLKLKSHTKLHAIIVGDLNIPLSPNEQIFQTEAKQTKKMQLTEVMTQMDLIDITECFFQIQKNILFQQLMEFSPKLTIYLVTKQVSRDTRKLK